MSSPSVAEALERARTVLARRPDMGLHDDAPASARWTGGTACITTHANGTAIPTDMPKELGGSGTQVTPGFLFRAGVASCTATRIAMGAAVAGIALTCVEVDVQSRSDTRGLLGMADDGGADVDAGPCDLAVRVRVAASNAEPARLRALVEESYAHSPISCAAQNANDVALTIDVVVD